MEKTMKGKRIKAGLAAARARGVRLGNPRFEAVRAEARAADAVFAARLGPMVEALRADGLSYGAIATQLNKLGVSTQRGGPWTVVLVSHVRARSKALASAPAERVNEEIAAAE
jgi:DNA invertase Pin-like site-specific DNA recombinase